MKKVPDLYIQWGYDINACTVGAENPIIILNSGLIDLCDDDEIMFVIGHECGHVKSNHMLYHMMGQVINYILILSHSEVLLLLHYSMLCFIGIVCLSLLLTVQGCYVVRIRMQRSGHL